MAIGIVITGVPTTTGNIEVALRTQLLTDSTLLAIVGTRIYPVMLPMKPVYPCITFEKFTDRPESTMDYVDDVHQPVFRLICWSPNFDTAMHVKRVIHSAIQGWDGVSADLRILNMAKINEVTSGTWNPDVRAYGVVVDYIVSHDEETV